MKRVVFDTVIIVRGLINPYGQWGRIVFDRANDYQQVVSPSIVAEYLEVIRRPELVRKYRSVDTRDPHAVLTWLAQAEVVEYEDVPAVSRDPKDDPFLATATVGNVDLLVSEDRDLLDRDSYEDIPIVTGSMFLKILDAGP
ncbi:MAG TPA: putative toxin-antitoxin system toxin component, PIN family [Thermomicrobiales bacterium]|nr:putative toxin-antitoxin system toxin component, PIN family [Thermomicrobiales bacterium]